MSVTAALVGVAAAGLTGCVASAAANPPIVVANAAVPVSQTPGMTVAYVVIRNNRGPDRLLSATISGGGHVVFGSGEGPNGDSLRILASVPVPAHSTLAMEPGGVHMVITGARHLQAGKDVQLTLDFAHAGDVSVVAQVTNPATGGSSYLSD